MSNGIRALADVVQFLAIDDFDSVYVPLNGAFSYPSNLIVVTNDTNYLLFVSFDGGVTTGMALAPNSNITINFSANSNANGKALYLSQLIPLQVRTGNTPDTPAGTGVAVTSFYTKPSAS